MNILDQIIADKVVEVSRSKSKLSIESLKNSGHFLRNRNSMVDSIKNTKGIIAEFKRKSPSKGNINIGAGIVETTQAYTNAGAAGISVLTDTIHFGGFAEDLKIARKANPYTPLLRKDFIIDPYQLFEAKAWGADVILLIAANLSISQVQELSQQAHELGLEVLLEVHNYKEIQNHDFSSIDIIGVNNRNLKNFAENNINVSLDLFKYLPQELVKISESCISNPESVMELRNIGYQGFLMGENFMKTSNPGNALKSFLELC